VKLVRWAEALAIELLAEPLPARWAHTQGVAGAAEAIASIVGEDAELLLAAAWLHDIGYCPDLAATGFHPLDGARYLRDAETGDDILCRLVANHSCAIIEARNRGLASELAAEFPAVDGLVADALTYCDMTTDPEGRRVDVETRLSEILSRYGNGSIVADSIEEARSQIMRSVEAVAAAVANQS
jgi:putative nucleotidyltransferase with HDIG domain